jgi:2-hydroxychromene-2-carboxylate isomerase
VTRCIEFFFDFLSPYAYLAHCRLPALADEYGYELVYKPFNMHAAKRAAGNTTPPGPAIPVKFRYICTDFRRWAERYGVPFSMPWMVRPDASAEDLKNIDVPKQGLDTTWANKGMFFALDRGQGRDYANRLWGGSFGANGLVGSHELLMDVARQLGWSPEDLLEFVQSDAAEARYEANTREAVSRGVFGAPTMFVDDEMWWGNDRLGLLEEYLAAHPASQQERPVSTETAHGP